MPKKPRAYHSFRTQLTLTIIMVVLAALAAVSLLANLFINIEFEKRAREQQQAHAAAIAAHLSHQYNSLAGGWNTEYVHGVGMTALYDGYILRVADAGGNPVWDAENHDMETCSQVMMEIMERMEEKRPGLKGGFEAQEYVLTHNGDAVGRLVVQYYGPYFLSESDFNFLDSLNLVLLVTGALALGGSVAAAGLLARRISSPVIKTAHLAAQIAGGNYEARFTGATQTRELEALVVAVNDMAASLGRQEALRKRLAADIAHELRTPLSAVSAHLEAIIEGVWQATPERLQSCFEEIGRISGLVAGLESLEQVESANLQLQKTPVNLLELARMLAQNFEREAAKKHIAVEVRGEDANVPADKAKLTQVMTNLLSNAIKYTPEHGKVCIDIKNDENYGIFVVSDNGIGISAVDLPLIFERFYRADLSRSRQTGGAGIGLTIAKSIVHAHGGTLGAQSDGLRGSRFTVALPKGMDGI